MAAHQPTCPPPATAANISVWNMHSHVLEVGFPPSDINEIHDITASLLTKVCRDVCMEPNLQPVTTDQLSGASANQQDGARLDIYQPTESGVEDLRKPTRGYLVCIGPMSVKRRGHMSSEYRK